MSYNIALPQRFINDLINASDFETLLVGSTVNILGFNYNDKGDPNIPWSAGNMISRPEYTRYLSYTRTNGGARGCGPPAARAIGCVWGQWAGSTEEWKLDFRGGGKWLLRPAQYLTEKVCGNTPNDSYENQMSVESSYNDGAWEVNWTIVGEGSTMYNDICYANATLHIGEGLYMTNSYADREKYSNCGLVPTRSSHGRCTFKIVKPGQRLMEKYCETSNIWTNQCIAFCGTNNCQSQLREYCINTPGKTWEPVCTQWCSAKNINCDIPIQRDCDKLWNEGKGGYAPYTDICGCWSTQEILDKFSADLNAHTGSVIRGDIVNCLYPPCTGSPLRKYSWKNGTQSCPGVTNCINTIHVDVGGTLDALIISPSAECSGYIPSKTENGEPDTYDSGNLTAYTTTTDHQTTTSDTDPSTKTTNMRGAFPKTTVKSETKKPVENNKLIISVAIGCGIGAIVLCGVAIKMLLFGKKGSRGRGTRGYHR